MRPLVSVIFPCYNAGKFLKFSLESILNQEYNHIEVICVNDGSTDNTLDLLEAYQSADTRISIINNKINLGLIDSLNNALAQANGEFFARVDADDFCEPDRFSKQVSFLSKNPGYDLVSSGYYYFVKDDKKLEYVPPVGYSSGALRFISLFSTPLTHGATLGRKKLITNSLYHYDKNFQHSEDFELFSRLAWQGVGLGNLKKAYYWLRINPDSVSVKFNAEQIATHLRITRRNLETNLGISSHLRDSVLKTLCNRIDGPIVYSELKTAILFLDKCFTITKNKFSYLADDEKQIKHYLNIHKLNIIIQSNKVGFLQTGISNLSFFIQSLFLLRLPYFPHIMIKIFNYIRYRLF